jgi:Tfp pilus assembly pilus retraction ATPase PilT
MMTNILQTGGKYGMQTLDNELIKLAKAGTIKPEDAIAKAHSPDSVKATLDGQGVNGGQPQQQQPQPVMS